MLASMFKKKKNRNIYNNKRYMYGVSSKTSSFHAYVIARNMRIL